MRILVVGPERRPEVRDIDGSLKAMQEIVGFALHEAARFLKMSKGAVVDCMEDFCCRARVAIG